MRTKSSNEKLISFLKKKRNAYGLSQQDYCDYLKETYGIDVSKYVVNGIENGGTIVNDDLKTALYHDVYYIKRDLQVRDEILEAGEKIADFFVKNKIDLNLETIFSFYIKEEIASFLMEHKADFILKDILYRKLPQEVSIEIIEDEKIGFLVFKNIRIYFVFNETALLIYSLCYNYIIKKIKEKKPYFNKRDYLSADFSEIAITIFGLKNWNSIKDERSKGRLMTNINKKFSFSEYLLELEITKKYYEQCFPVLKENLDIMPKESDRNLMQKIINGKNEDYTIEDYKSIYELSNQNCNVLVYIFAWCQHKIIFPHKDIVLDLERLYQEIHIKDLINKERQKLIKKKFSELKAMSKNLSEENFYNYLKCAQELYELHRRLVHFDFNFFVDFE